jgi:hypothetical protein
MEAEDVVTHVQVDAGNQRRFFTSTSMSVDALIWVVAEFSFCHPGRIDRYRPPVLRDPTICCRLPLSSALRFD